MPEPGRHVDGVQADDAGRESAASGSRGDRPRVPAPTTGCDRGSTTARPIPRPAAIPGASPTTGLFRAVPPVEPSKGASPKVKMPPSEATPQ